MIHWTICDLNLEYISLSVASNERLLPDCGANNSHTSSANSFFQFHASKIIHSLSLSFMEKTTWAGFLAPRRDAQMSQPPLIIAIVRAGSDTRSAAGPK